MYRIEFWFIRASGWVDWEDFNDKSVSIYSSHLFVKANDLIFISTFFVLHIYWPEACLIRSSIDDSHLRLDLRLKIKLFNLWVQNNAIKPLTKSVIIDQSCFLMIGKHLFIIYLDIKSHQNGWWLDLFCMDLKLRWFGSQFSSKMHVRSYLSIDSEHPSNWSDSHVKDPFLYLISGLYRSLERDIQSHHSNLWELENCLCTVRWSVIQRTQIHIRLSIEESFVSDK